MHNVILIALWHRHLGQYGTYLFFSKIMNPSQNKISLICHRDTKNLQIHEEQIVLKYTALTKIVRVAFHLFFSPGRASNLAALRSDSLTKSPLQSHVTFGLGHACTWASKIRIEGSGCFSSGCSYILAGTLSSSSGFPP